MLPPLALMPVFALVAWIGLRCDWGLGRWAVAFAAVGWILLAQAEVVLLDGAVRRFVGAPSRDSEWLLFAVVACEAIAAALLLALFGRSRARDRAANAALWMCALFVGALCVVAA